MDSLPVKMAVTNLDFWYGAEQVLFDITVDFPEKMITSIIGPSGSGKSTFLRTLNRIFELQRRHRLQGKILLNKENILDKKQDVRLLRSKVGMVFQKPTPFPMSIADNVAFGLRLREKMKPAALMERVEWSLHRVGLWDEVKNKLTHSALGLSGGQQQRLCIARAIAIEPEVLLLDEPCSALDPIATQRIEELVLELKQDYTIIIVTHNMQQAMRISDYTAYFFLGRLLEFNQTHEIFHNPRNESTLQYVRGRLG